MRKVSITRCEKEQLGHVICLTMLLDLWGLSEDIGTHRQCHHCYLVMGEEKNERWVQVKVSWPPKAL